MISFAARDLAAEVAEAHADATLAAAGRLVVSFSSGGLAFAAKGQSRALAQVEAVLSPLDQRMTLTGTVPHPWTVDIADSADLKRRLDRLRSGHRRLRWEPEDVGAFAAAAIWTYLTLPLLLGVAERVSRPRDYRETRRLRITLPPDIAGHGRTQTLHIGPDSLIHRHDYTATAFGRWARAAQTVGSYRWFDGVPVGTWRTVTPRLVGAMPAPTLVWIRIHGLRIE